MKKILGSIRNKPMMSFTLFLCTTLLLMILLLLNVSNIYYILLIPFINNNKVNATEINNNEVSVKNFQSVDSIGYLYNFDGSPDYIYIDFMGKNGYVIFSNERNDVK